MSVIFLARTPLDPEMTAILAAAFDAAWEKISNSGGPPATERSAATTRDELAKRLIAAMQGGESDPDRLVEDAIRHLTLHANGRPAADEIAPPT
jgi:hypothetical protein